MSICSCQDIQTDNLPGKKKCEVAFKFTSALQSGNQDADAGVSKAVFVLFDATTGQYSGQIFYTESKFKFLVLPGKYDIEVIANCDQKTIPEPQVGESKKDYLKKLVYSYEKIGKQKIDPTLIPMCGELRDQNIMASTKLTVDETRIVSRIDISLDQTIQNFTLSKVILSNVASDGSVYTNNPPYLPEKYQNIEYTVSGNQSKGEIYSLETPANTSDLNKTPFLILEGTYTDINGVSYPDRYYRVDFTKNGSNPVQYESLTRNVQYYFTVKKVYDNGFATPDEAIQSRKGHIDCSVTDFEDGNMNYIFSGGGTIIGVDKKFISLTADAKEDISCNIYTDSNEGWKATVTSGADWLRIVNGASGGPGYSTCTLASTQNSTKATRNATVTIQAANLQFAVHIEQSSNYDSDITIQTVDENGKVIRTLENNSIVDFPIGDQDESTSVPDQWIKVFPTTAGNTLNIKYISAQMGSYPFNFLKDTQHTALDGSGPITSNVAMRIGTEAITPIEIIADPLIIKATMVIFMTDVDPTYQKAIIFRQAHWGGLLKGDFDAPIDQDYHMHYAANTNWKLTVTCDDNALIKGSLKTLTGESDTSGWDYTVQFNASASVPKNTYLHFLLTSPDGSITFMKQDVLLWKENSKNDLSK